MDGTQAMDERTPCRFAARRHGSDDGVTLIEVLVALFSLALVSIAAASFLVSGVNTTEQQSQTQNAVTLATQALEAVQAVPVSQVLIGRTKPAVQALVTDATFAPLVVDDIVTTGSYNATTSNYDATATATSVPVIPITTTQTLKGLTYQVRTSIDPCYLNRAAQKCQRTPAVGIPVLRATVNITWRASECSRCSYSSSVLLDRQGDPVYALAVSRPIIVTITPSTAFRNVATAISVTGRGFAAGLTLATTAGGSFSNIIVSADGKRLTAIWSPGSGLGEKSVVLTNPDTGQAQYTPMTVTKP